MIETKLAAEASSPDQRMTFDELRQFVEEGVRREVPPDALLYIQTKGLANPRLKRIEVMPK